MLRNSIDIYTVNMDGCVSPSHIYHQFKEKNDGI